MIYLYPMYVRYTRNLFLRALCVVYLFVFTSLYVQIPGLFGTNGILPARTQLYFRATTSEKLQKPTLLWFAPSLGLNTEYTLDILALLGVILSCAGFLSQKVCTSVTFLALWVLYYSIYVVGQIFMRSDWDALLVETGLLAVLLAPLTAKGSKTSGPVDAVIFFLVRWLLFRLTFSTGTLKLVSGYNGWFKLHALNDYFENQPLPNVLSWYAHHLPTSFLRVTTVFTIVMETLVPCLYFLPVKSVHSVAFILQVFLQLCICLTGNHSYHNIFVITLALSLIDDQFFNSSRSGGFSKWISRLVCCVTYGLIVYVVSYLYTFTFSAGEFIKVDVAITLNQVDKGMTHAITVMTYFAAFTFLMTLIDAVWRSLHKISAFLSVLFYGSLAAVVFGLSVVPFNSIHSQNSITRTVDFIRPYYTDVGNWHLINSYGAFKPPGNLNGRPEIIIEGSNLPDGPWLEYEFLYKPGNVNNTLPFVAPHKPRLDEQLVAAASTPYGSNPWLLSLAYRLLKGTPEVHQLLDNPRSPFPYGRPKFIRASKYVYHFTDSSQRNSVSWWKREKVGEYFPPISENQTVLLETLSRMKITDISYAEKAKLISTIKFVLDTIRHYTSQVDASFLPITLFIGGCIFILKPGTKTKSSGKRRQ